MESRKPPLITWGVHQGRGRGLCFQPANCLSDHSKLLYTDLASIVQITSNLSREMYDETKFWKIIVLRNLQINNSRNWHIFLHFYLMVSYWIHLNQFSRYWWASFKRNGVRNKIHLKSYSTSVFRPISKILIRRLRRF